jgi:hypothetical protein
VGKHHAHTARNFLSIKKTRIEYYIAGESHFYLKPNEIVTNVNVTDEIFDFATDYQMEFPVVCLK